MISNDNPIRNDFLINDGVLVKYKGSSLDVVIPPEVTAIGPKAFECADILSVVIPEGVTEIGYSAFHQCRYLSRVSIPPSVTSIDSNAFSYCQRLTDVSLPTNLLVLGESAFHHCDRLTHISIPASILSIGKGVFSFCEALAHVSLPDHLTTIGDHMFSVCRSLQSIALPSCLKQIGPYAFTGDGLQSITLPEGLQTLGPYALKDCNYLQELDLPESVQEIGVGALSGTKLHTLHVSAKQSRFQVVDGMLMDTHSHTLLLYTPGRKDTAVTVPDTVQEIGPYAFQKSVHLQQIHLPSNITSIGEGAFMDCKNLREINLPQTLPQFNNMLFYNCKSLTHITLPNGPESLACRMFEYCEALEDITIPPSVKIIQADALDNCNALRRIDIPAGVTELCMNALPGGGNLEDLYIHSKDITLNYRFLGFHQDIKARIHVIDPAPLPEELKMNALMTTIADDPDPKEERSKRHVKYLKARQKTLCPIAMQFPELLVFMCKHKVITPKYIELYNTAAQESGDLALIATMMDYVQQQSAAKKKPTRAKDKVELAFDDFDRMFDLMEQEGIEGMTFAIASKIPPNPVFQSRSALRAYMLQQGAKLMEDVRTGVDYLITSTPEETSDKTKKADALGIEKMTWNDFLIKTGLLINDCLIQCGVFSQYRGTSENVIIPEGVREITSSYDYPLFPAGSKVRRITIPASVDTIAETAFSNCEKLEEIVLAEGNAHFTIINGALLTRDATRLILHPPCKKTFHYTVPETVTTICENAFNGVSSLQSISLPAALREIGFHAFRYCTALKEIHLPQGITELSMNTFSHCTALEKITLPKGLNIIDFSALECCTRLTEITLPDSLTTIRHGAFQHCLRLQRISFGDQLTEIDPEAFSGCGNLREVIFRGQNKQALTLMMRSLPSPSSISIKKGS